MNPWRRLRASIANPAAWGLGTYLALGLLLRLPAILFADGYLYADHQFQYVDPAWHIATGDAVIETVETTHDLRSWVYPGFLAGIFRALNALGVTAPLVQMAVARAVHALLSCATLAAFWLVVVRWRPVANPRPVLLFFAAAGVVVYSAVQPTAPTLSAQLVTTAVLLFLGPRSWAWFASGFCIGLAFCCRVQDAFFGPVLFGAALWSRQWRAALWLALGTIGPLALQGIVDIYTMGGFFRSAFNYLDWNLVQKKSALWRQRPFWFYALVLVPLLGFFPPFLRASVEALRRGARVLAVPLIAALLFVVALSFIGRKSVRFLAPSFDILMAVLAVGLFAEPLRTKWARMHRRVIVYVQVGFLLVTSFVFFKRGPIEAAIALGERSDFRERLVVVEGPIRIGGTFYLRRQPLEIVSVSREALPAWLQGHDHRPLYVMVTRRPLERTEGLALVGRYGSVPDLWESERRFLYRAE